jgi:hypothetical protein
MRQSRSSVLPKTGDEGTPKARSLLVPRLMGVVGVLGLLASFGLMAVSAPAHARVQNQTAATGAGSLVSATLIQQLSAVGVRAEPNGVGIAAGGR